MRVNSYFLLPLSDRRGVYCIGDVHPGIWNLFQEIGGPEQRQEILNWYHLKENLYKAGGSRSTIKASRNSVVVRSSQ